MLVTYFSRTLTLNTALNPAYLSLYVYLKTFKMYLFKKINNKHIIKNGIFMYYSSLSSVYYYQYQYVYYIIIYLSYLLYIY